MKKLVVVAMVVLTAVLLFSAGRGSADWSKAHHYKHGVDA